VTRLEAEEAVDGDDLNRVRAHNLGRIDDRIIRIRASV
jgi:hypothetical protein